MATDFCGRCSAIFSGLLRKSRKLGLGTYRSGAGMTSAPWHNHWRFATRCDLSIRRDFEGCFMKCTGHPTGQPGYLWWSAYAHGDFHSICLGGSQGVRPCSDLAAPPHGIFTRRTATALAVTVPSIFSTHSCSASNGPTCRSVKSWRYPI